MGGGSYMERSRRSLWKSLMDLTRLKDAARKPGVAPVLALGGLVAATVLWFALSA